MILKVGVTFFEKFFTCFISTIKKTQSIQGKRQRKTFGFNKKYISNQEITLLTRQLATLLMGGLPLVQALLTIAKSSRQPRLQLLLNDVATNITAGHSFVQALENYRTDFGSLYIGLVHTGEQSGLLDKILIKLAEQREKSDSIKSRVKRAIIYPIIIFCVAIMVTVFLLLFVVPNFKNLFTQFGATLPPFTLFIIHLAEIVKIYYLYFAVSLVIFIYSLCCLHRKYYSIAKCFDKVFLSLPILGEILKNASSARFARSLSTLISSGMPLLQALKSVAPVTGNRLFNQAIYLIMQNIAKGESLAKSMRLVNVFPEMALQMVYLGEESGKLEYMLAKIAEFYENAVDNSVATLSSLLEPLIIGILGILVGGLILGMYLPIFQLGNIV